MIVRKFSLSGFRGVLSTGDRFATFSFDARAGYPPEADLTSEEWVVMFILLTSFSPSTLEGEVYARRVWK